MESMTVFCTDKYDEWEDAKQQCIIREVLEDVRSGWHNPVIIGIPRGKTCTDIRRCYRSQLRNKMREFHVVSQLCGVVSNN